jgi:hypothetical protein
MANEQLIEEVADKIEDVAVQVEEVADATRRLTGREVGFFVVGAGLGVAVGFAVGYRIAEKRLKPRYEKYAEAEIGQMREHYLRKMRAATPKPPVEQVVVEVEERNERGFTEAEQKAIDEVNEKFPADEEKETTQVNVFEASEEWNYQYELAHRSKHVPYIIHLDEFTENAPEHDQTTYTYYEIDDVMADSRDTTIEDMDASIGLGNLGRWGHGSNDPNVVYVRNEVLGLDVEIVRDRGSWSETVRGTIRHSADRRRRPNRRFDDDDVSR